MQPTIEERIARIRASVSLPNLLLSYGVDLKQSGNEFKALCIAHDDHNPSMSVYVGTNGYHRAYCHSCGFGTGGGDVIDVYKKLTGTETMEALDALDGGEYMGTTFATIKDEPPLKRAEREVFPPPPDTPPPVWNKANYKNAEGEWVSMGEPVGTWCYRTREGATWYYEARYEVDGRKEPRCWTWGKRGAQPARWEVSFPPKPRPLYGLDELADATQVLICEGPRKAEAARKMLNGTKAVACVGWPGGANGVKTSDWTPLEGKALLLMPDNDEPGTKAMHDIASRIAAKSMTWIDTSAMPEGWDAADAVAEGWDKARFVEFLKANKREYVAPDPVPEPIQENKTGDIYSAPPPHTDPLPAEAYRIDLSADEVFGEPADLFAEYRVPPLDYSALPEVIAEFVRDRAYFINTDPAYGALSCIVTAAGMIDDRIKLHVQHDWNESARLWGCIVGEVSSKKSPMLMAVTKPLNALVEKVAKEDAEIARRQDIKDKRYAAKYKEYVDASIKSDDHNIPLPPLEPSEERLRVKCKSLTTEGLEEALRYCPRGIYADIDELAGWLGSMDAYRAAGAKKDRALWLEAFNGGPLQKDLVGRGSFLIPNWSVTIMGGIQPSKMREIGAGMTDDGLLQRFLVVVSSVEGGQGNTGEPNKPAIKAWGELLDHLFHTKTGGTHVRMTPEAAAIRDKAVAEIYTIIKARFISPAFCGHLGKWEGLTARMMLTFWCIESAMHGRHPESAPITAACAEKAMRYMMRHLLQHAVSFYEDGLGQSEIASVTKLIGGMIVAQGDGEITTSKLKQYGPNAFRQLGDDKQRQVLARLVEMHWLMPRNLATSLIRHPTRYIVNPAVHELFAKHKQAEFERIEARRDIAKRIKADASGE